jgi:hypothetical protein
MTDDTFYNHATEVLIEDLDRREPERPSLDAFDDFILYGVRNGSFAKGPEPNSGSNIDADDNKLPNWSGPTQVSGTAITCQWVTNAAYPSEHALRFTIAAGAVADEAYVEQIVPIGGSAARWFGVAGRLVTNLVSASASNFRAKIDLQYLDINGADVGPTSSTWIVYSTTPGIQSAIGITDPSLLMTSAYVRIRISVDRFSAGTSATAVIDVTDVRTDKAVVTVLLSDHDDALTYKHGVISQQSGIVHIAPDSGSTGDGRLQASNSWTRSRGVPHQLPEISAPATPASGYYDTYAKADSRLYGKNDAGTERQLDLTAAEIATALASTFQPLDSDLSAIALLSTTSFGRSLLTAANAAALQALAGTVIGTNVQAWDTDLDAIATLGVTNDSFIQGKGGVWSKRTVAQVLADLAAAGTTFQPLDSDLTAFAGLASAADKLGYFTGAGAMSLTDLTATARSILDDTSIAAVLSTLGLGTVVLPTPWPTPPVIGFSGGVTTPNFVYSTQSHWYARILDLVIFSFTLTCSTFTYVAAAGQLEVQNLPVASNASTARGWALGGAAGWTKTGFTQIVPRVVESSTSIRFLGSGDGKALTALTFTDVPSGGVAGVLPNLQGLGIYRV